MKVTITIDYQSRNSLDESLAESEIKETIEGLMMSLRNQVINLTHNISFGEVTKEETPVKKTVSKKP
jgi:hypothetical protein